MTRYFLDTAPLVGVTFLHDLWRDEAERLFETDNSLYTSRAVIYEYCNRTSNNSLESTEVSWGSCEGLFGEKFSNIRVTQTNLDIKLRSYGDEELDIETLVDEFVSVTGIEEEVYPQRLIRDIIRPNIREFLQREIGGQTVTQKVARRAIDVLCDTIMHDALETRDRLQNRVTWGPSNSWSEGERNRRLGFVNGYRDKMILCDAAHQRNRNLIEKLVTADKSHMYENRGRIDTVLGLPVVYIKDEFAEPDLPSGD
ncbi:hypothetical protein N0B31_05190 [Salinirubellus salinus]|uniref:Uncharacterized protein n=1 Tax=Salinirubellus salinus TaxID=1364945 RepID=A0A9E7R4K7_9EURY|nr:hypothetical protein [Salinirubellus salinus]UWM55679.1 hypothetical protein N0B31_05190 [Salinirubellus salinus]